MIARKNTLRKLTLNKETLRQLAAGELKRAVGGISSPFTCYGVCTATGVKPRL